MDIFILVFLAASLFGGALLASSLWLIFTAWRKAKLAGLSVNFTEAKALAKFYELEPAFLKTCADFKSLDSSISVRDIVRHHMADGDSLTLLDHWKKIKEEEINISFKSLVLYELSGKQLEELISSYGKVYEIKFEHLLEDSINISYYCSFIIDDNSTGWIIPDLVDYTKVIKNKIELAILAGDLSDFEVLSAFILEKYLHEKFWKSLCHGVVQSQQINITR